jgi:hypothetical protein
MHSQFRVFLFAVLVTIITLTAWGSRPVTSMAKDKTSPSGKADRPVIDPHNFGTSINNPYFPLKPGTTFISEGTTSGAKAHNETYVTHETKVIQGVRTVVVRDKLWLGGRLAEETIDWYAQDKNGNVWYFGENTREYGNKRVVNTQGSWEAGVNGARPGVVMFRDLKVGHSYRQEYYKGQAEDMAQVLNLNETISVPYGSFQKVLKTKEWTPLEPGVVEYKYYAPGAGCILTTAGDQVKLVKITTEKAR